MRRSTKIILSSCFLSLIATQYTNCESYNENTFASSEDPAAASTEDATSCNTRVDPNCEETNNNKELLSLSVNLTDVFIASSDLFFNISGTCFDANFPANSIRYKLIDGAGNNLTDNLNVPPMQQPKCERGEWDFQVTLPNGFNRVQSSSLILELVAYDSLGQPVVNDLLAKKTIAVRNNP
jgi:hypothetical protein